MKVGDVVVLPGLECNGRMTVEAIDAPRSPGVAISEAGVPGMPGVSVYEGSGPIQEPVRCVFFVGNKGPFRCTCERSQLVIVS